MRRYCAHASLALMSKEHDRSYDPLTYLVSLIQVAPMVRLKVILGQQARPMGQVKLEC